MKKKTKIQSILLSFMLMGNLIAPLGSFAEEVKKEPSLPCKDGVYTISSPENYNKFREDMNDKVTYEGEKVILTEDIDLKDVDLIPYTVETNRYFKYSFEGIFDGKGHSIKNYCDNNYSLIANVGINGVVTNVNVHTDINIGDTENTKQLENFAVIANTNRGRIKNTYVCGNITIDNEKIDWKKTKYNIGGIVYELMGGGIENCCSSIKFKQLGNKEEYEEAKCTKLRFGGIECNEVNGGYYPKSKVDKCIFLGSYDVYIGKIDPIKGIYSKEIYPTSGTDVVGITFYNKDEIPQKSYFSKDDNLKGKTTEELKTKQTYLDAGFDFNGIWKIDETGKTNDGYPYIDSTKEDINVDVKVNVEDKTYDGNLNAKVTSVEATSDDEEIQKLIKEYNVGFDYDVNSAVFADRQGCVDVQVKFDKLNIEFDDNSKYNFVLGKTLPAKANLSDNKAPVLDESKKPEYIKKAQQASNMIFDRAIDGGKEKFKFNEFTQFWNIFSAARVNYPVKEGYYDEVFENIQETLKKLKKDGQIDGLNGQIIKEKDFAVTEWAKLALAITAIGYDIRDIESYDIINILANDKANSSSGKYLAYQTSILALDSHNYPMPKGEQYFDKEQWIHKGARDAQKFNLNNDVDMSTMGMQPILKYYDPNAKEGDKYYDVKLGVEHVIDILSKMQSNQGYYTSMFPGSSPNNPWTNSQAMITLAMGGVDVLSDSRFTKNGNNIFDAQFKFFDFENNTVDQWLMNYEPPQITRAFNSCTRTILGQKPFFDCTDTNSVIGVKNAIEELPKDVTTKDKEKVEKATALYNKLSGNQKKYIKNYEKLQAAQKSVEKPSKPSSSGGSSHSGGNSSSSVAVDTKKIVGNTRYETAIKVSKEGWNKADNVVLVNGDKIPDALASTPFAKQLDAPILLTQTAKLNTNTKSEIQRLGAKNVYVIGGEAVVSNSVIKELQDMGIMVERIAGATRFETSLAIANKMNNVSEVAVVNGETGLSDATSVASVAANKNMPILLSPANGTDIYDKYMKDNNIKKSYIIGQTNAISKDAENKLVNPERIGGLDRNETNAKIISKFYTLDKVNNMFICKNGMKEEGHLIDALSVGSLAAKQNAPVVIVGENLAQSQKDVLKSKSTKAITQIGGGCEKGFDEIEKMYKEIA